MNIVSELFSLRGVMKVRMIHDNDTIPPSVKGTQTFYTSLHVECGPHLFNIVLHVFAILISKRLYGGSGILIYIVVLHCCCRSMRTYRVRYEFPFFLRTSKSWSITACCLSFVVTPLTTKRRTPINVSWLLLISPSLSLLPILCHKQATADA